MKALPYTRTGYACTALHAADSVAPIGIAVIAHALSRLLSCTHAIRAGCLYSYADDDVMSERRLVTRAACASSGVVAGKPCTGGGLPFVASSASTGMHRLYRLSSKVSPFETGGFA